MPRVRRPWRRRLRHDNGPGHQRDGRHRQRFAIQLAARVTTWCSWRATWSDSRSWRPSCAANGASGGILPADLSDAAATHVASDRLADENAPVEILVNNAGFGMKKSFLVNDLEAEGGHIDVLVRARARALTRRGRAMKARGHRQIINVSSVAGWLASGTYSAAKSWVTVFSEGLAGELAGSGVTVTALSGLRAHRVPRPGQDPGRRLPGRDVARCPDAGARLPGRCRGGQGDPGASRSVTYKALSTLLQGRAPAVCALRGVVTTARPRAEGLPDPPFPHPVDGRMLDRWVMGPEPRCCRYRHLLRTAALDWQDSTPTGVDRSRSERSRPTSLGELRGAARHRLSIRARRHPPRRPSRGASGDVARQDCLSRVSIPTCWWGWRDWSWTTRSGGCWWPVTATSGTAPSRPGRDQSCQDHHQHWQRWQGGMEDGW